MSEFIIGFIWVLIILAMPCAVSRDKQEIIEMMQTIVVFVIVGGFLAFIISIPKVG